MNTTPRAEVAQITALIERAKDQRDRDAAEHCPAEIIALQDEVIAGLEALEAEKLGLRLECQGLKAEVAEVKSFWKEAQLRNRNLLEERDALAAELAGLKAQEPVAVVDANDDGFWADILPNRDVKVGQQLFAAPKALAPHEDTKLLDYLQVRQATVEILIDGHGLSTPLFRIGGLHGTICADIRGAIGAAIGIGGTP